jgi:hypothetical protein
MLLENRMLLSDRYYGLASMSKQCKWRKPQIASINLMVAKKWLPERSPHGRRRA